MAGVIYYFNVLGFLEDNLHFDLIFVGGRTYVIKIAHNPEDKMIQTQLWYVHHFTTIVLITLLEHMVVVMISYLRSMLSCII